MRTFFPEFELFLLRKLDGRCRGAPREVQAAPEREVWWLHECDARCRGAPREGAAGALLPDYIAYNQRVGAPGALQPASWVHRGRCRAPALRSHAEGGHPWFKQIVQRLKDRTTTVEKGKA